MENIWHHHFDTQKQKLLITTSHDAGKDKKKLWRYTLCHKNEMNLMIRFFISST